MEIGKERPDYEELVDLFPESQELKERLCEYLATIIEVCTEAVGMFKSWTQTAFKSFDAKFAPLEKRLKKQGQNIERRVRVLQAKQMSSELGAIGRLRNHKLHSAFLNACSGHTPLDAYRKALKKGESSWAQNLPEFSDWRDCSTSAVMWCEGKLGSGKSVSAAHVVDALNSHNPAYFFCEFHTTESLRARTILGSLAKQLLGRRLSPDAELNFEEGNELEPEQIFDHVERILPSGPPGYCLVIDGLNECPENESRLFIDWLERLFKMPQIFRIYFSVRSVMLPWAKTRLQPRWTIQVPEDRPEIKCYIETEIKKLTNDGTLQVRDPNLIHDIKEQLLRKCDGM
jgi:NACHT domain